MEALERGLFRMRAIVSRLFANAKKRMRPQKAQKTQNSFFCAFCAFCGRASDL
jgi:hypothetical protein